jgi:uncharacterized protein YdeI (YjbR/CyaY-like superfamily)
VTEKPRFFADPGELRAWFAEHATTEPELLVGYLKRGTGRPSLTWAESVDEALCVGWIDGVRRRVDDESYTIRFTPRRPGSTWSRVNIARLEELNGEGRVTNAGHRAYEERGREGVYSHEQPPVSLDPEQEAVLRATPGAWDFFAAQPPSYRQAATWWVVSAKRADTRERRVAELAAESGAGRRVRHLRRP